MIPLLLGKSTHQLHFNIIDNGKYQSRNIYPIYAISPEILETLANKAGWKISRIYGGYQRKEPSFEPGSTHVWILE